VGHVAGDHVVVDGDMIEAVDGMPVRDGFGQLGLAAAEIANDITAALPAPADHLFIGYDRPILAGFAIQRVVLFPFLRVGLTWTYPAPTIGKRFTRSLPDGQSSDMPASMAIKFLAAR
jgi:hypothetical protein